MRIHPNPIPATAMATARIRFLAVAFIREFVIAFTHPVQVQKLPERKEKVKKKENLIIIQSYPRRDIQTWLSAEKVVSGGVAGQV